MYIINHKNSDSTPSANIEHNQRLLIKANNGKNKSLQLSWATPDNGKLKNSFLVLNEHEVAALKLELAKL